MSTIVLTEEQRQMVAATGSPVSVRDAYGNVYSPIRLELTAEQIAEMQRRAAAPGPRFTGEQIQATLKALEAEWGRTGGFDHGYAQEFIRRLHAGAEN